MVVIGESAGEFGERAREVGGVLAGELVEEDLELGEMLLGEREYIFPFTPGGLLLAALRAAQFEIERLLGLERRQPFESAPPQHRSLQRQLGRKSHLDFLGARRCPAFVVDEPRAARREGVDSVGPRAELERCAARERDGDCAVLLDPDARRIEARFAVESEKEVEARFDTRPIQSGEGGIGAKGRKALAGDRKQTIARLGREGAERVCLDKLLQRGVPRDSYFARPHVAFTVSSGFRRRMYSA